MDKRVTAIVLAAGESRRMGEPKLLLPWGDKLVLEQTLHNVGASRVAASLLVSGHRAERVAQIAAACGVPVVHNPAYAEGEMLSSLQVGLRHLGDQIDAALVVLADQPLVGADIYNGLIAAYAAGRGGLIAPAYLGTRGNPVLIDRRYFSELLALPWGNAPRVLLARHPDDLYLLPVDSAAVLQDLDRPDEYRRHRPPA